jgi:hypothetical protein
MVLFWMDSDWKLNTKNIDYFLIFSTVIYLPSFNQWFRSYDPLEVDYAAEFLLWAALSDLRILNL